MEENAETVNIRIYKDSWLLLKELALKRKKKTTLMELIRELALEKKEDIALFDSHHMLGGAGSIGGPRREIGGLGG